MAFRLSSLTLVLALLMFVGVHASARIQKVVVGVECTFPPLSYKNEAGKLVGYEVDLLRQIGLDKDIEFDFVCTPWDDLQSALIQNEVDMVAAGLSITEERQRKFSFSRPYLMNSGYVIVRKFSSFVSTLFDRSGSLLPENWAGVRFGVLQGTTHYNWAEKYVPEATLITYQSVEKEYEDLRAGRIDAMFSEYITAQVFMTQEGNGKIFAYAGPRLEDGIVLGHGVGYMFNKRKLQLRALIDDGIWKLITSDKLDEIGLRYFLSKPSAGL